MFIVKKISLVILLGISCLTYCVDQNGRSECGQEQSAQDRCVRIAQLALACGLFYDLDDVSKQPSSTCMQPPSVALMEMKDNRRDSHPHELFVDFLQNLKLISCDEKTE